MQFIIAHLTDGNVIKRFIPSNIINFFIPYLFFKKIGKDLSIKLLIIFMLPSFLLLLVSFHAFFLQGTIKTIPYAISINISILSAYYISQKKEKIKLIIIYIFIVLLVFYLKCNFYYGKEYKIDNAVFIESFKIINENNAAFNIYNKKNKILILELWSSNCSICFKKFPDFEKLSYDYRDDSLVEFYTLNLPLKRDSVLNIPNLIKNYKFKKLYSKNKIIWDSLNVNSVPRTLVLDKDGRIRYNGLLNNNNFLFYNNINLIIRKLKNE